jgi:hypothetical protein
LEKTAFSIKKFKWEYYQTKNFNVYFNAGGQEIAKYVVQAAEKEFLVLKKKQNTACSAEPIL